MTHPSQESAAWSQGQSAQPDPLKEPETHQGDGRGRIRVRRTLHILPQPNPNSWLKVHLHLVSPSCPLPYLPCRYQRFLSDYEELSGWMKEKTALISADELPTDVASGEALLDRHRQHKVDRKSPPTP